MSARLHVVFGFGPTGRAVADALLARGEQVRVVTHTTPAGDLDPRLEVVLADATDLEQASSACVGATHVYQCMNARDYHRWPEQFPPLQRGVLAAAKAAGATLIALENLYGYGAHGGTPMTEDMPLLGRGSRASTRVAMTRELDEAHERGELTVVRVRAADLIGPHVRQSMAGSDLVEPILDGARSVTLLADPDLPHAFSSAADVGMVMATVALDPTAAGLVFHVPSVAVAPRALVSALAIAAGRPAPAVRWVPRWALPVLLPIAGVFVPPMRGLSESTWMFYEPFLVDSRRFEERYGRGATPLATTLEATVAWYSSLRPATRPPSTFGAAAQVQS